MKSRPVTVWGSILLGAVFVMTQPARLQAQLPTEEIRTQLTTELTALQQQVDQLKTEPQCQTRDGRALWADVAVCAKAVEWMLRHNEFPKKDYAKQAAVVLKTGHQRATELAKTRASWSNRSGCSVRGYVSRIDGSIQPYALTLPDGVNPLSGDRWPLHIKLHGRANDMNEVNFISRHEGQTLSDGQTWIQLDVYGRGNNAYRWAGETDVFEALADVRRRFRIDDNRITLHGFSMGGAGAWHLGLHHPAMWSSVGPGAGFVDFYKYQNQTEQLPKWQHENLGIYDAIDYALNAANVPVCTYGGENDAQLVASTSTQQAAKQLNVDIKLLIGPGMGHKFHPDSFKELMAFHKEKAEAGRLRGSARNSIRFTTRTLKYNKCDWLTIEEVNQVYAPSTVEATVEPDGTVAISTTNVDALSLARDIATQTKIDGVILPCYDAADGLLPNVIYQKSSDGWDVLDYDDSRSFQQNPDLNKRHGLQGPIDDAFMEPFLCVTGSGSPQEAVHQQWADWTLQRFRQEYDKWLRADLPVVSDANLTEDQIRDHHLVLFGDPQSNSVIAQVLSQLPIQWSQGTISVAGRDFNADEYAISLVYPNPLNPQKYVVLNSGHTFHEKDFKASNSWLFPRLGDIAVQKVTPQPDGTFVEEIVWAANFNSAWTLDASNK